MQENTPLHPDEAPVAGALATVNVSPAPYLRRRVCVQDQLDGFPSIYGEWISFLQQASSGQNIDPKFNSLRLLLQFVITIAFPLRSLSPKLTLRPDFQRKQRD